MQENGYFISKCYCRELIMEGLIIIFVYVKNPRCLSSRLWLVLQYIYKNMKYKTFYLLDCLCIGKIDNKILTKIHVDQNLQSQNAMYAC